MTAAFAPWQQRAYDSAVAALDAGRLGHGLLFTGPAELGKRAVAERLAQRVLCSGDAERPCGACRSCRLFEQRFQRTSVETRPDGSLAHPRGHAGHPDVSFVGYEFNEKARPPKMRTEIVIEQIRQLSERLALTPQYGVAQVAIIEPADALNTAAGNALLKTLEEPVAGRYLWLVSAHPMRLPATIRSRCQQVPVRMPARDEAEAWLRAQVDAGQADAALEAAGGHPGLARAWIEGGALALRGEVQRDLAAIARGEAAPGEVAQRWTAGGDAPLRLRFASDIAHASARDLTDPVRTRRLAAWFDHANRTRELLRTTVRADLAVAELLVAWRAVHPGNPGGRRA